jgi:WD40 repeat protein
MPESDSLQHARDQRRQAERRLADATAAMKAASIQAKQDLRNRPGTLTDVAASLHLHKSVVSRLSPQRNGFWEPRNEESLAAIDTFTGGIYRLVELRREFDAAADALGEAMTAVELAEARTERAESRPRRPNTHALFVVPDLPRNFVPRLAKRQQVITELRALASQGSGTIGLSSAADLRGAGGYGKTTLALDAARQTEVMDLFPDGVVFIEIGRKPAITTILADWTAVLGGSAQAARFATAEAAGVAFAEAIGERQILLILDNVWESEDVLPFLQGGPRCVRLITSRRSDLLPPGASGVNVDRMEPEEAVALLTREIPGASGEEMFPLYERSSRWPVVLGLFNGVLRSRTTGRHALPVSEVVGALVGRLDQLGVAAADDIAPDHLRTASAVLKISVEELAETSVVAKDRFLSLAAFPPSALIGLTLLADLWECDVLAAGAACDTFAARSLLESTEDSGVRIHDVVHDYLRREHTAAVRANNTRLVTTFRNRLPVGAWHLIETEDEHFLDHLAYHLVNANEEDELADLVQDLRFLGRRIAQGGAARLRNDIVICDTAFARDPYRQRLDRVLRFSGHLLAKVADPRSSAATLHSRLIDDDLLPTWLRWTAEALDGGIVARHPMPDRPDSRLLTISVGHREAVNHLAWRPDGVQVASGSGDGTVWIWSSAGTPLRTVTTPGAVTGLAWSPNRLHLAALSAPNTIMLIEPITGSATEWSIPGPEVTSLAWSPDSALIAVGTDEGLILADPHNRRIVRALHATTHARIMAVAWHKTSGLAVLAAAAVFHWTNPTTCSAQQVATDLNVPKRLAWTPDGTALAAAGADKQIALLGLSPNGVLAVDARSAPLDGWVTSLDWRHDSSTLAAGVDQGSVAIWGPSGTGSSEVLAATPERDRWEQRFDRQQGLDYQHVRVAAVTWNPTGPTLAVGAHTNDLRLFNLSEPPDSTPDTLRINCVRWHPTRPLVVAGTTDGELAFVSTTDPNLRWTFPAHPRDLRSIAFSPDGQTLVSAAEDGLRLWRFTDDNQLEPLPQQHDMRFANAVCWNPRKNLIALGGQEREAIILDAATWQVVKRIDATESINALDLDPTGTHLAIATVGSTIRIYDSATDATTPLSGHTSTVAAVRWANSARTLLSAGYDGHAIRWTLDRHAATHQAFDRDGAAVWDVAYDHRSKRAVTVTTSGLIDLHDVTTLRRIHTVAVDGALGCAHLTPDGSALVTGGAAGLYFFEMPSPSTQPVRAARP